MLGTPCLCASSAAGGESEIDSRMVYLRRRMNNPTLFPEGPGTKRKGRMEKPHAPRNYDGIDAYFRAAIAAPKLI